jgi:type I restriction enzyme S subunit
MGWKEYQVQELGRIVTGHTPFKQEKKYYESRDYPWIKPTDINIGERFVPETEESYSQKAYLKYRNSLLPPLSTCVVTIGTVGEKICLTSEPCFSNQWHYLEI